MDTAAERRRIGLAIGVRRTEQARALAALAQAAGCSRELVRRAELGDPGVPPAKLRAICAALGLSAHETDGWLDHLDYKLARDLRAHAMLEQLPYLKEGLSMLSVPETPWTEAEQRTVVAPLVRMAMARMRREQAERAARGPVADGGRQAQNRA